MTHRVELSSKPGSFARIISALSRRAVSPANAFSFLMRSQGSDCLPTSAAGSLPFSSEHSCCHSSLC